MNFIEQMFASDLWQKGMDKFTHNILSKFISIDILYKEFFRNIKTIPSYTLAIISF